MVYFRKFFLWLTPLFFINYSLASKTITERLALNAESFIGLPYDALPIGKYVAEGVIIDDSSFDCMSHTFRSLELALSKNEEEALENALWIRFLTKGEREGNKVKTYEGRFEYGEDMALSGKFGRLVNYELGQIKLTYSERYKAGIPFIPIGKLDFNKLQTGDIIYFTKRAERRKVGEIVGHLGILKIEGKKLYLIHASGVKNKGGEVKKVLLENYLKERQDIFEGILITRL
jgi:hypothetical protein